MKKLIKFVKTGESVYNLVSKDNKDSNHVLFIVTLINKGYAGEDLSRNKHMNRKMRQKLPRGKAHSKMGKLGFRMK